MLGRAAERFIRTKWKSVDDLAQELYACFSPDLPIQASSIVINQAPNDTSPPFTVNRAPGGSGPTMVINRDGGTNNFGDININGTNFGQTDFGINNTFGSPLDPLGNPYGNLDFNGSTITFGDFNLSPDGGYVGPSPGGGSGGGIDLGGISFPGQDPATKTLAVPSANFNPFILYGEVSAKLSGNSYAVLCWAKSPASSPKLGILTVRFPAVNPSEVIPAGTPTPVICFPGADPNNLKVVLDAIGFVPAFLPES